MLELRKQTHWKKMVESFSQRWYMVLDRALVELCTQVLTGYQTTRILIEFSLPASGPALSCLTLMLFLFLLRSLKLPGHLFLTPQDKG